MFRFCCRLFVRDSRLLWAKENSQPREAIYAQDDKAMGTVALLSLVSEIAESATRQSLKAVSAGDRGTDWFCAADLGCTSGEELRLYLAMVSFIV